MDDILRIMPEDSDAERAVLSCMLLDPESIIPRARTELTREDFYIQANRMIFTVLDEMFAEGEVDLILLQSELRRREELEKVGGLGYLARLVDDVPTTEMFAHYAEKLQRKTQYRELIKVCSTVISECYRQTELPEDLAKRLESHNTSIFETVAETSNTDWKTTLLEYQKEIEAAFLNKGEIPGISTGLPTIDDMTGGFQESELWVLAGRPGSGKTAMLVNIAVSLAQAGIPVGIISLEMSRTKLAGRIISGQTGINSQKIARGYVSQMNLRDIGNTICRSADWPLYIDDRPGLRSIDIEVQCRKWVKENGIKVLFVDYLQLVEANKSRDVEEREVSEKSKGLLNLARRHNITTFSLAQLNRGPENRSRPPKKSDLRGSGAIEQDAHVIALLDRCDPEDDSAIIDVNCIIAKCREGREGVVNLDFNRPITTFTEAKNPGQHSHHSQAK